MYKISIGANKLKIKFPTLIKGLHWTTVSSERVLLAVIGVATCIAATQYLLKMFYAREILLADLFMLFIFVEIIGMVGALLQHKQDTGNSTNNNCNHCYL